MYMYIHVYTIHINTIYIYTFCTITVFRKGNTFLLRMAVHRVNFATLATWTDTASNF